MVNCPFSELIFALRNALKPFCARWGLPGAAFAPLPPIGGKSPLNPHWGRTPRPPLQCVVDKMPQVRPCRLNQEFKRPTSTVFRSSNVNGLDKWIDLFICSGVFIQSLLLHSFGNCPTSGNLYICCFFTSQ